MPTESKSEPKFNWSAGDVEAGMIVCRAYRGNGKWKPDGWTAKWTHKIGFIPGDANPKSSKGQYCQIAMTDGMVYCRRQSKESMAKDLTESDMIPMPYSWWIKTVRFLRLQSNPSFLKFFGKHRQTRR